MSDATQTPVQTCYRHADRKAGVRCQRCERPICPSCMHQASVGFHCPECTKTGAQRVVTARTLQKPPLVSQALVALNVAIFAAGVAQGGDALNGGGELIRDGALVGFAVADGEWYRLVTSGFLHYGLLHLGLNMFALWNLGSLLEPAFGRLRFGIVYATSLLAGSLGVMILEAGNVTATAGASGAVFGLMGAAVFALRARGISIFQTSLGTFLILNLALTFGLNGISIGGHLGGLAGGLVCGYLMQEAEQRLRWPTWLAPVLAVGVGVACFVIALSLAEPFVPTRFGP